MRISRKFMLAMVIAIVSGQSAYAQQQPSQRAYPWSSRATSQHKRTSVPAIQSTNGSRRVTSRPAVSTTFAPATPTRSTQSIQYSNPAVVVERFQENPIQHNLTDTVAKAHRVVQNSELVQSGENIYLDLDGNVTDAKTFASLASQSISTQATTARQESSGGIKQVFKVPSLKKPKLMNPLSMFSKKNDRPIRFAPDVLLPKSGQFPTSIEDRASLFANTLPSNGAAQATSYSTEAFPMASQPQTFDVTREGSVWEPMPVNRTASQKSSVANFSDFNPY